MRIIRITFLLLLCFALIGCQFSGDPDTSLQQGSAPPTETSTTTHPTVPPVTEEPTVPPMTEEPTVPPTTKEPTVPPTTEQLTVPPMTDKPTVPPTTVPAATPTVPPTVDDETTDLVWIPQTGKKYHISPSCSGMKEPAQVTKEEAENRGFTPCKRCYAQEKLLCRKQVQLSLFGNRRYVQRISAGILKQRHL